MAKPKDKVKAHFITFSTHTGRTLKKEPLTCWVAVNDKQPCVEVALTNDNEDVQLVVDVDLKDLIRELKALKLV